MSGPELTEEQAWEAAKEKVLDGVSYSKLSEKYDGVDSKATMRRKIIDKVSQLEESMEEEHIDDVGDDEDDVDVGDGGDRSMDHREHGVVEDAEDDGRKEEKVEKVDGQHEDIIKWISIALILAGTIIMLMA